MSGPPAGGRRVVQAAAMLFAAIALIGCSVDQDAEIKTYRSIVDLPIRELTEGQPLTLRDALLLANQDNETLSIEGENYLRSIIERRRAAAEFQPTVDLFGRHGLQHPGDVTEVSDLAVDLDLTLFQGFRNVNRYWRDTFVIEQRRNDLLAVQEALLLDTAVAYYQVLRSEALVRVLENSVRLQGARLDETQARYDAGVARPLDVAQGQAQLSVTRTTLVNARRDVHNGRTLLAFLTGRAVGDVVLSDEYALPAEVPALQSLLEQAYTARHGLKASAVAVSAARRDVEVAFGQYYPTVSLNFNTLLRSDNPDALDWQGILNASIPLFSAGRIHADVREAWSFFREAVLVQSNLRRQVEQQVRQAYENHSASVLRMAELNVQVAAAQQAFDQAQASYEAGLATNLDRVAAQDSLLDAQIQLASEEYDRKVFYLTLVRNVGGMRAEVRKK